MTHKGRKNTDEGEWGGWWGVDMGLRKKAEVGEGGGVGVGGGAKFRHGNQERTAASFPQETH